MSKIHSLKRPAIERMLRIHQLLKAGKFPNCTTLARELEVSTKTISRDIDFMRDRMLLPIEYASDEHGFCYTREVESLPTIDISEGELLALSIARKAMDHYRGTPFEKPLSNALNKLSASLPETITANLGELSEAISFRQARSSQVDDEVLQAFTRSALEKREITFRYKKLGAQKDQQRTFHTYHLTNFLGKWYAIGLDTDRDAIRTFLLSRASLPRIEAHSFNLPEGFSAEDYLGSSFGIYSPEGSHDVRILFRNPIAEYISENTWHPSQNIEYKEDGSIIINFRLSSLVEVAPWVLSWSANAVVLEPKALIDEIKKSAIRILDNYD